MSSPKHLWSGDWRHESEAASEAQARLHARPREPEAPPAPAPRPGAARPREEPPRLERPRTPRRPLRAALRLSPRLRQVLPVALAVMLILAAGAYGLTRVLNTSDQPAALSAPSGPMNWLGMQIESVNPGTVVIETVAPGSPAERAGLNPGDLIAEVNHRPITSTSQISAAIAPLRPGTYVEIQVNRGTTPVTTQALLVGPPSSHP